MKKLNKTRKYINVIEIRLHYFFCNWLVKLFERIFKIVNRHKRIHSSITKERAYIIISELQKYRIKKVLFLVMFMLSMISEMKSANQSSINL